MECEKTLEQLPKLLLKLIDDINLEAKNSIIPDIEKIEKAICIIEKTCKNNIFVDMITSSLRKFMNYCRIHYNLDKPDFLISIIKIFISFIEKYLKKSINL